MYCVVSSGSYWRGRSAAGHQLDLRRAVAQVLAGRREHLVAAVGDEGRAHFLGARRLAEEPARFLARVPEVAVAGGLRDHRARRVDPRADRLARVDRLLDGERRTAQIAHGGESAQQHLPGLLGGARLDRRVARLRIEQFGQRARRHHDMHVVVDQPRHDMRPPPGTRVTVRPAGGAIGAVEIVRIVLPTTSTFDGGPSRSDRPSKTRTFSNSTAVDGPPWTARRSPPREQHAARGHRVDSRSHCCRLLLPGIAGRRRPPAARLSQASRRARQPAGPGTRGRPRSPLAEIDAGVLVRRGPAFDRPVRHRDAMLAAREEIEQPRPETLAHPLGDRVGAQIVELLRVRVEVDSCRARPASTRSASAGRAG